MKNKDNIQSKKSNYAEELVLYKLKTCDADTTAREFWSGKHKEEMPNLYKIVKKWLIISASSSGIERKFSKAQYLDDDKRSRLNKRTFAETTFLNCNIDLIR